MKKFSNSNLLIVIALVLSFSHQLMAQFDYPRVVVDIRQDPNALETLSEELNGFIYFKSSEPATGNELYKTDGTTVTLVKDIFAGSAGGFRGNELVKFNNKVFFSGWDGVNGIELWASDGTAAGTTLIKDIMPGTDSSYPEKLTVVGAYLYFTIYEGDAIKLYRTDGSTAGTVFIQTIIANTSGSEYFINEFKAVGTKLCFFKSDFSTYLQLWACDGTNVSMVKSYNYGFGYNTEVYNNKLYFSANDGVSGLKVWSSDGTSAGTSLLDPSAFYYGNNFLVCNGFLYFNYGNALYKSDGTAVGTATFKYFYSEPAYIRTTNSLFFFVIFKPGKTEVWRSNGTEAGTFMLKTFTNSDNSNYYFDLKQLVNGTIVFTNDDFDNGGQELWKTDGTVANTVFLSDIRTGYYGSDPHSFKTLGNNIIFSADDGIHGREIWKTDGTTVGTISVSNFLPDDFNTDIYGITLFNNKLLFIETPDNILRFYTPPNGPPGIIHPNVGSSLTTFNNKVFFGASPTVPTNYELYSYDGTTTSLVKEINAGDPASNPNNMIVMDNKLYFSATTATQGNELWRTDGTTAGTVLASDVNLGSSGSFPQQIKLLNPSNLLFLANAGSGFYDLHIYSNTGTLTKLTNFNTNTYFDLGADLTIFNNEGYFTGCNEIPFLNIKNCELWKYNGTTVSQLKDLNGNSSTSSNPRSFVKSGSYLFFTASGSSSTGRELWRTDGTSAGTVLVKDINVGSNSSNIGPMFDFNGILYFSADDGGGAELWKSDGTTAGTVKVKDINPAGASNPTDFRKVGNGLYFSAIDGKHGRELWKTDGTVAGTVLVYDIYMDKGDDLNNSNPAEMVDVNGTMYFVATDGYYGRELHRSVPCITNQLYFSPPSQTVQATNNITAGTYAIILPKRQMNFFAGKSILLQPGFEVSATSGKENLFRAEIRGCY